MNDTGTFGPAFEEKVDGKRIRTQMDTIRSYMLQAGWQILAEIAEATDVPPASASAQLRHLRKTRFGGYDVRKRRRGDGGTWEYRVRPMGCMQGELAYE